MRSLLSRSKTRAEPEGLVEVILAALVHIRLQDIIDVRHAEAGNHVLHVGLRREQAGPRRRDSISKVLLEQVQAAWDQTAA
jgi:hypothetical protein